MRLTINDRNKESVDIESSLKKQLKSLESKMDKLDNKYIYENLGIGTYQVHKSKIEGEIEAINREKENLGLTISNLNKKIDRCIEVAKNISDYWAYSLIEDQIRLQKLIFPSGIVIDPIKRQYRTTEINSVFSLIASISKDKSLKAKTHHLK